MKKLILFLIVPFLLFAFAPLHAQTGEDFGALDLEDTLTAEEEEELMLELDMMIDEVSEDGFGDGFDEDGDFFEEDLPDEESLGDIEVDVDKKPVLTEKQQLKASRKALKVKLIFIKGGCFMMGDNFGDGHYDERPLHKVCIDDYYLAEAEVTQELWEKIAGFNPSLNKGPDNPVENVSYADAVQFIDALNEKTNNNYRLPSEAEWEYAARGGGLMEKWAGTNDEFDIEEVAWYYGNSEKNTHPVKGKQPNRLGLYDMSGNVWEWVFDYYDMGFYAKSEQDNPEGPLFSIWKGLRGGSYIDDVEKLRSTARYGNGPTRRSPSVGFRLAQ